MSEPGPVDTGALTPEQLAAVHHSWLAVVDALEVELAALKAERDRLLDRNDRQAETIQKWQPHVKELVLLRRVAEAAWKDLYDPDRFHSKEVAEALAALREANERRDAELDHVTTQRDNNMKAWVESNRKKNILADENQRLLRVAEAANKVANEQIIPFGVDSVDLDALREALAALYPSVSPGDTGDET